MSMTPEKTSSISYTSTSLSDSALPITVFSKSALDTFLSGVQSGADVAIYFASEGGGSSNMYLILAEKYMGTISSTNYLKSSLLPCPPHCKN